MSTQSETVTVRISPETKSRLETLARQMRRTKSFLAGEAIADYVDRESKIIEGILQGLEDMEAGHVVPHDEAMARLRKTIRDAKRRNA
ncbi:MAG: CopG family ribbon-helix-helix protein [Mesorhizobium sp.]|nr:CopG family ribbon-helix-helix protein [Mesorhizobium sp.]MBN9241979.1 CopG family ribbon-helix-helix protein [Mesorhizobium sp.]